MMSNDVTKFHTDEARFVGGKLPDVVRRHVAVEGSVVKEGTFAE